MVNMQEVKYDFAKALFFGFGIVVFGLLLGSANIYYTNVSIATAELWAAVVAFVLMIVFGFKMNYHMKHM